MTIFGVDVSKYQGPSAMDGYEFAILNVEDPTIGAKIDHAYDTGVRWDIYKWCYPGQSGQVLFDRARDVVNRYHRAGTRRPQFWLDYEEAGVAPWQIDQWYAACDAAGETTGLYIYLYLMNNQGVGFTRDGWLAYYPGTNSGDYYPSMSDAARARGAKVHQYTSSGGSLDKNVILDEAWYHAGADEMSEERMREIAEEVAEAKFSNRTFGITEAEKAMDDYLNTPTGLGLTRVGLWSLNAVKQLPEAFKKALGL